MIRKLKNVWYNMRKRCYSKTYRDYTYYGAKGITICDEWKYDYLNFERWAISNNYKEGLFLDRIDNSKGYSPINCRWITKIQSNKNKTTVLIYNGLTLGEWCDKLHLSYKTIYDRIKYLGWSIDKALTTPIREKEVR